MEMAIRNCHQICICLKAFGSDEPDKGIALPMQMMPKICNSPMRQLSHSVFWTRISSCMKIVIPQLLKMNCVERVGDDAVIKQGATTVFSYLVV